MILLVTRSSTEPTLFHVGCRPSLHVGLLQYLYLTLSQNGQHSHLTMRGTHPTPCQKGTLFTFTSMIVHNYYHMWKGITLTSTSMIGHNYYHLWKGIALTFDLDSSERHSTYIHQHYNTQLLSSMKRHSTQIHQHDRTQLLSSVERHSTHI